MRITQSMIVRDTLTQVQGNRLTMHQIQERISTQKKVQKASDDPTGYSRIQRYRTAADQNEQFLKNIFQSRNWIETTVSALENFHDFSNMAKGIAIQAADGAISPDMRAMFAQSLRSILEESLAVANTRYLDKNVFAGTHTTHPQPFTLEAGGVTYAGNDDPIQRKISAGNVITINTTGQQIMDTNFFTEINNLIAALENNDVSAIQNGIDIMAGVVKEFENLMTVAASSLSGLMMMETRLTQTNVDLTAYIADEENAILEEEIVKFKAQEIAYQAALQTAADVMKINILRYL